MNTLEAAKVVADKLSPVERADLHHWLACQSVELAPENLQHAGRRGWGGLSIIALIDNCIAFNKLRL